MHSDMDALPIGTYVHGIGTESNGVVAQTLPNGDVLLLTVLGGHFFIVSRKDVQPIAEENLSVTTLTLVREFRKQMGVSETATGGTPEDLHTSIDEQNQIAIVVGRGRTLTVKRSGTIGGMVDVFEKGCVIFMRHTLQEGIDQATLAITKGIMQ